MLIIVKKSEHTKNIDEYLSKYNYVRVETSWTNAQLGMVYILELKIILIY